jgi:hypothetical protein
MCFQSSRSWTDSRGLPGIKKQRRRCGAQGMRRVDALLNFLASRKRRFRVSSRQILLGVHTPGWNASGSGESLCSQFRRRCEPSLGRSFFLRRTHQIFVALQLSSYLCVRLRTWNIHLPFAQDNSRDQFSIYGRRCQRPKIRMRHTYKRVGTDFGAWFQTAEQLQMSGPATFLS